MIETKNPVRNFIRPYFDNACMVREQRKELRGTRIMWIWFGFLAFLTLVSVGSYSSITASSSKSLSEVQSQLNSMYLVLINILAFFLPVASIMGTATSLVQERNSRSLEMVMTTPVDMRAYLLGRLLASYRTTLLYLVLALPFISITVLIGGYTWWEVISALILLSFHSLVLASMGLAIGATQTKEGSATFLSFVGVFAYQIITAYAAAIFGGLVGGAASTPWLSAMNSFWASLVSSQSSPIMGIELPNVVIVAFVSVILARLFLMSACSTMAPMGTKFTLNFRLHSILFALFLGCTNAIGSSVVPGIGAGSFSGSSVGGSVPTGAFLAGAVMCVILGFIIIPISTHDRVSSIRNRLDGLFSWQAFRVGTPAGTLPFILLLFICTYFPQLFNVKTGPSFLAFLAYGIYGLGFMLLSWGITMLYSFRTGLVFMAKTLSFVTFFALNFVPNFVCGILRSLDVISDTFDFRQVQFFRALLEYKPTELIVTGLVFIGIATWVALRVLKETKRLHAPPIRT